MIYHDPMFHAPTGATAPPEYLGGDSGVTPGMVIVVGAAVLMLVMAMKSR